MAYLASTTTRNNTVGVSFSIVASDTPRRFMSGSRSSSRTKRGGGLDERRVIIVGDDSCDGIEDIGLRGDCLLHSCDEDVA